MKDPNTPAKSRLYYLYIGKLALLDELKTTVYRLDISNSDTVKVIQMLESKKKFYKELLDEGS